MFSSLKNKIAPDNPMRLFYHKIKAILACFLYACPSRDLVVIGITGTNGKTTTANLISQILDADKKKNCLISTTKLKVGEKVQENLSKMTSPSPFFIQKLLHRAKQEECRYAVVEVSSHAISQHRIWGINFDLLVFTNISHDHLDYHGSFSAYRKAKGEIFRGLLFFERKEGVKKIAVLNREDKKFDFFNSFPADEKITFGIRKGEVQAKDIELASKLSTFSLKIPNQKINIKLPLPGIFNIKNALAAAATAMKLNIPLEKIKSSLEKTNAETTPGRMEFLEMGQKFTCLIDFAHTPEALEEVLLSIRKTLHGGKIWLVFGCTGNRDQSKREIMGKIAHKNAEKIILTSDDPYFENPFKIIRDVEKGISREEGKDFWIMENRVEAIRLAIFMANSLDIVLIAGKGAEKFQIVAGQKISHSDKEVASRFIQERLSIEKKSSELVNSDKTAKRLKFKPGKFQ